MAVKVLSDENENEVSSDCEGCSEENSKLQKPATDMSYKHVIVYKLVFTFLALHILAVYGIYVSITKAHLYTTLWAAAVALASSQGILLGAHRGYTHRAFKMTLPIEIIFIIFQTMSGQNHIYWWARDHRLHHKCCDTDADPYNASRGFFFSHIGWLLSRKHPMVAEKGKSIDMSDLEANKLVMFQRRYFIPMFLLICIFIPSVVPVHFWNESLWNSVLISFVLRYVMVLNMTWCVNSIAHMYGTREFDKRISARQSFFSNVVSLGEGWHNYHHSFPWDHAYPEFGRFGGLSTQFLYLLHRLGMVYDLKRASQKVVQGHSRKYGDGTLDPGFATVRKPSITDSTQFS
ncbi:hypothetical protein QAD02_022088 [Eretmocerus hayati]|uniref:Uncharacterized protein n=1 Tax=Eretmocerus hayati TaxID=131215 RepID=A0ACC2PSK1_9HYME|nr:hypothetical protein QAD02_022088 [Eretmocerus hayati]